MAETSILHRLIGTFVALFCALWLLVAGPTAVFGWAPETTYKILTIEDLVTLALVFSGVGLAIVGAVVLWRWRTLTLCALTGSAIAAGLVGLLSAHLIPGQGRGPHLDNIIVDLVTIALALGIGGGIPAMLLASLALSFDEPAANSLPTDAER